MADVLQVTFVGKGEGVAWVGLKGDGMKYLWGLVGLACDEGLECFGRMVVHELRG